MATSDCYNAATSATSATSEVLTAPPASVPPRAPVTADVPEGGTAPAPVEFCDPAEAALGGPPQPPPSNPLAALPTVGSSG